MRWLILFAAALLIVVVLVHPGTVSDSPTGFVAPLDDLPKASKQVFSGENQATGFVGDVPAGR